MNYRSIIISLILLCSYYHHASAQLLISDGIVYHIISDNEVEVYKVYNHTSHYIPNSISQDGTTWKVVGLADRSFSLCYPLEVVVLPETLRFIGHKAFEDCKNLKEIRINATVQPDAAPDFADKIPPHTIITIPGSSTDAYIHHRLWGQYQIRYR